MSLKQMTLFGNAVSTTKNLDSIRLINANLFPHMNKQERRDFLKSLTGQTPGLVKL